MIPIYTRFLSPRDYGVLELLDLTINLVTILIGCGIANAMFRYYYYYLDTEEENEIISTGFILIIIIFSFSFFVLVKFASEISLLIFASSEYKNYLTLMFSIMLLSAGLEIPMAYLRIQHQSIKFIMVSLARLIMMLSLNVYFLVFLGLGISGILYSTLITTLISVGYLTFITFRDVGFVFSSTKATQLLKYGYPIIFSGLTAFVIRFSDRYFLQLFRGLDEVGIYSLGFKFGFLLTALVITPIDSIWSAQKFQIAKQINAKQIFSKIFTLFNLLMILFGGLICVLIKDILLIVCPVAYWGAYQVVPYMVISNILYGWFLFTSLGIHLKYKTKYFGSIGIFVLILDILMNYFLVPLLGMFGAALTISIAFLIRFSFIYYFSIRLYPINYEWNRILAYLILISIFIFLLSYVDTPWIVINLFLKLFAFLGISFFLAAHILLRSSERDFIKQLIFHPSQWSIHLKKILQTI
jgi:O-antigen/teichoic acid export membrane protein